MHDRHQDHLCVCVCVRDCAQACLCVYHMCMIDLVLVEDDRPSKVSCVEIYMHACALVMSNAMLVVIISFLSFLCRGIKRSK